MGKNKDKKQEVKEQKSVRLLCYLHQLSPMLLYLSLVICSLIGKYILAEQIPNTSGETLSQNKATIDSMVSTVTNLNTQKKNLTEQKATLDSNISNLKLQREADGSLRFYTGNLPAYGRYVEFRAKAFDVEIVSVDISQVDNKVDYVVLGTYSNLVNFFASLETREIYYVENFELLPSFSNSGSYAKFTANFNLDATITQRYQKKVQYSDDSTLNLEPSDISSEIVNVVPEVDRDYPDDTMNTGKSKAEINGTKTEGNQVVQELDNGNTVVEPIN